MNKSKLAFFELEAWEREYLELRLAKITDLKNCQFFEQPLETTNLKQLKDVEILSTFIYSVIDKSTLEKLPNLKYIATMSTGFDHIDIKAAAKKNIKVSNVPFYGENTVAEHTFALILALSRKLIPSIEKTRHGDFNQTDLRGFDLKDKTLGIIGFGHIGEHLAQMAQGFQMNILAFDIQPDQKLAKKYRLQYVSLNDLLKKSEVISLHAPYNKKTHHLINSKNIFQIKKGAVLVNTARGGLIETEALFDALKRDLLSGIGLDVLEEEFFIKEEKELLSSEFSKSHNLKTILENHLLLNDPRVIITPHNAFNSKEALTRILDTTIDNISGFLSNKPINLVT
ncbi:MAG: hypothetical protein UT11_C0017G0003 [Berkelbacteria bacterium GW2011_GWA2_38_9]|uniref:Hydroxyacid dehydrogenase n=1 Tax=Berkelbacteria bacterium GW2011_GWA2_38_9 TaxID=1618334 RepID=A0A0G0LPH6_9BACT|nr:MAG: hypothetical protein UT11_C0017G0003 [Berkelbacteria bacterium GW2011_GWA2_38_9]